MIIKYYGISDKQGPGQDNTDEWEFLQEVIGELKFNDSVHLHVVSMTPEWDHRDAVVLDKDKQNIIIGLKNEYLEDDIPQHWTENATVFKAYLLPEHEQGNVHSFPLGYNRKHVKLVNRPIKDRPVDVFFAGNVCAKNKRDHISALVKFFEDMPAAERPNIHFFITKGFNVGLEGDVYSQKLHDAKIAVCPPGNVSMETFRHYESMRSGTVIVSPKLPQTKIYKDAAICQIDNWMEDAGPAIMDLLSDLDMLQLVQERQQQTYNNRFTAKSVAKYINELLPTTK